jgi:response regulator of citrate/malate metabolism
MAVGLNVIIVDDDPAVCEVISQLINRFYTWGEVLAFTSSEEAMAYCLGQQTGVAIFVLDVYLGNKNAFGFLDGIRGRFPMAPQDTIIITGNASNDVVNMCVASDISYLLEKPVKPYALQLAIRAIVAKYLKFAKRLLEDPLLAASVAMV